MAGNPKDSKWYNGGARADRKRKKIEISLSDAAREKLERLANGGHKSPVVERLILEAPERQKPTHTKDAETMKLYLLTRQPLSELRKRQEYDVTDGLVIAAASEADARQIATKHSGDEGPEAWTNPETVTCEEIAKRTNKPAGCLLRDFNAG